MSRTKFPPHPVCTGTFLSAHFTDDRKRLQAKEKHLHKLISDGTPLPLILNERCLAVDLQLAGVISIVYLSEDDPKRFALMAESAVRFSLGPLSSKPILSSERQPLGTFELTGAIHEAPADANHTW